MYRVDGARHMRLEPVPPVYVPVIDPDRMDYIERFLQFIKTHNQYEIENEIAGAQDVITQRAYKAGYEDALAEVADKLEEIKGFVSWIDV